MPCLHDHTGTNLTAVRRKRALHTTTDLRWRIELVRRHLHCTRRRRAHGHPRLWPRPSPSPATLLAPSRARSSSSPSCLDVMNRSTLVLAWIQNVKQSQRWHWKETWEAGRNKGIMHKIYLAEKRQMPSRTSEGILASRRTGVTGARVLRAD